MLAGLIFASVIGALAMPEVLPSKPAEPEDGPDDDAENAPTDGGEIGSKEVSVDDPVGDGSSAGGDLLALTANESDRSDTPIHENATEDVLAEASAFEDALPPIGENVSGMHDGEMSESSEADSLSQTGIATTEDALVPLGEEDSEISGVEASENVEADLLSTTSISTPEDGLPTIGEDDRATLDGEASETGEADLPSTTRVSAMGDGLEAGGQDDTGDAEVPDATVALGEEPGVNPTDEAEETAVSAQAPSSGPEIYTTAESADKEAGAEETVDLVDTDDATAEVDRDARMIGEFDPAVDVLVLDLPGPEGITTAPSANGLSGEVRQDGELIARVLGVPEIEMEHLRFTE